MWSQRDPSIRKTGVGNIFIKNLSPEIGHKELYDTFSAFGNILSCKVAMDEHGQSKGYGFVHFENQQCADNAVQTVNNNLLLEKKVFVGPFVPRRVRAQQLEKSWTNVFIKDIDLAVSNEELQRAFSEYGLVTSAVIMRKDDGSSLGFGFVNFAEHESAMRAVDGMHGAKVGNKALYCCRAQKKAEREAKLRKEWEQQKISKYQGINLYIKNIEDEIDEERLRKEFSQFGVIKSCKIMSDEKGSSKGFGFVCFSTPEESQRAINDMNSRILPGCIKPLYVALHEPKEIRRQKLTLNAFKGIRAGVPQGPPNAAMYSGPGQTVYYQQGANPGAYIYPQQMMPSMPRGWQPQYPVPHTGYPTTGAMGGRGGASAATAATSNRGRGNGSGTGARGGSAGAAGSNRGGNRGRNQQVPVVEQVGMAPPIESLTLAQVKQFPFEQQKIVIGERLYALISLTQPVLAGKITGMFLDSGWSIDELFALLNDEPKLNEKIEDAIHVLEHAQQLQGEGEGQ
jgi:polyadenylate-binding protein